MSNYRNNSGTCGPCSGPNNRNIHSQPEPGQGREVCQGCFENPHEEHQSHHRWREDRPRQGLESFTIRQEVPRSSQKYYPHNNKSESISRDDKYRNNAAEMPRKDDPILKFRTNNIEGQPLVDDDYSTNCRHCHNDGERNNTRSEDARSMHSQPGYSRHEVASSSQTHSR